MSQKLPTVPPVRAIYSLGEYLQVLAGPLEWDQFADSWIYRGQTKMRDVWPIVPKAARPDFFGDELRRRPGWSDDGNPPYDILVFKKWLERAVAYSGTLPNDSWEQLALAQHYGLATRLLDWTSSSLVALFFAVETGDSDNGAVYAYLPNWSNIDPATDSFSLDGRFEKNYAHPVLVYRPRPIDRRMLQQRAIFTYHPKPLDPIVPIQEYMPTVPYFSGVEKFGTNLMTIVVESTYKRVIRRELSRVGITRESLFPDLDGLSDELNRTMFTGSYTATSRGIPIEWLGPDKRKAFEEQIKGNSNQNSTQPPESP